MSIIEVNLMGEHKIIRKDRTKNKKSFRTYPLIPQIEMFLDWELQQQEKQRELMGSCYYMGDQEYICLDANGHLLRPDYVTSKFSELVKKRGLKKITFHGLRHSCASMLYEKGQDMKKIQEWLGHSTPVTTETIYAHLNVKHKDETAWIANDCLTLKLPESIKAGAF
jgi:phage integrase family site specific recombinase